MISNHSPHTNPVVSIKIATAADPSPTGSGSRVLGIIGAVVNLLILIGCATDNDLAADNFGNTVRHTIAIQTAYPSANGQGLDGQKAALAFSEYRKDVAKPKKVDSKELGTVSAAGGN